MRKNMIGDLVMHALSAETGCIDAQVVHPDGRVLVRVNDHWFFAAETALVGW
jgi:hypothetical protein